MGIGKYFVNLLTGLRSIINPQLSLPIPTFDDLQKHLQFWLDQKDKWFYFESGMIQSGSESDSESPPPIIARHLPRREKGHEALYYVQVRILGKIRDVVFFPPSLWLEDATLFTAHLELGSSKDEIIKVEKRKKYGLVFSQITSYEPIDDIELFLKDDNRARCQSS